MRALALSTLVLVFGVACDKAESKADDAKKAEKAADEGKEDEDKNDADPGDADKSANFAQPNSQPPPSPEGATTLEGPWLYVQTCAEPNPCPMLLQPAGDKHCRELELGGHVNWRLPSRDEVPRFAKVEALEGRNEFHWTRTPDEERMEYAWIVNPEDTSRTRETTIPRDRKPFRIRCVKEP